MNGMQILEVYDDTGVMTAKFRIEKPLWRWFHFVAGPPLAIIAFYLFQVW